MGPEIGRMMKAALDAQEALKNHQRMLDDAPRL